jgi:four helix bundle protein
MATIKSFEELKCWQYARALCKMVFVFISGDSFSKDYSLKNQIIVPTDLQWTILRKVSKGGGRKEFIQFPGIAKASAEETRSQHYRALDRNYINQEEFDQAYDLVIQTGNSAQGLISYLNTSEIKRTKYKVEEDRSVYSLDSPEF